MISHKSPVDVSSLTVLEVETPIRVSICWETETQILSPKTHWVRSFAGGPSKLPFSNLFSRLWRILSYVDQFWMAMKTPEYMSILESKAFWIYCSLNKNYLWNKTSMKKLEWRRNSVIRCSDILWGHNKYLGSKDGV